MKKRVSRVTLFWSTMAFAACLILAAEQLPSTNPTDFWTYISKTNPYKSWQHWPGFPGKYPGTSPHGAFLELYVNDIALKAAKAGEDMPYGAILVKENYGKDKTTLMSITPMYKDQGYDPGAGDWYWAKYSPTGTVMAAGKVDSCINCHREGKDFLFTPARQE
jgi:hypothetical protein